MKAFSSASSPPITALCFIEAESHIMEIRSPICEPEILSGTSSISVLLGFVNIFSDTLIGFIPSENPECVSETAGFSVEVCN